MCQQILSMMHTLLKVFQETNMKVLNDFDIKWEKVFEFTDQAPSQYKKSLLLDTFLKVKYLWYVISLEGIMVKVLVIHTVVMLSKW